MALCIHSGPECFQSPVRRGTWLHRSSSQCACRHDLPLEASMRRSLMILGTASHVGKSIIVTALCRVFRQRGLFVAPFKSQNRALHSFVCRDGSVIGRAQVAQSEAACEEAQSDMSPIPS